jgi:L-ascorbate metabolism protein UlaG (beta-lactamase superfamily)
MITAAVMHRFLPRYRPAPALHPTSTRPSGAQVRIRWLGTAGHVIETAATTLLLDPFLTRPGLWSTATKPLVPTPERWWSHLPPRVDAILLGHSHYDHLLDAPAIALRTGARIVGSATTASFARAHGVPAERVTVVPAGGASLEIGDVRVRFVPSLHGRIVLHRVPFPGEVNGPPLLPARLWDYRMGGAFGLHLETPGATLYHNGSADLIDANLAGLRADVLLVGLAGRRDTRDYIPRLMRLLGPRAVLPTHFDSFFGPLEQGLRLLPGIDLPGFVREVAESSPRARVLVPDYDDVAVVPAGGDAGETVFTAG